MTEGKTRLLYQEDSYLREFDATVLAREGNAVILDQTAFHPRPSGGLSNDTGVLSGESCSARVVDVTIKDGVVYHWIEDGCRFEPGEKVRGRIDWERRYRMMRLHTASHIIAALLYNKYGAKVTGGMIEPDKAKDDFDLSTVDDWKGALRWAVEEANRIAKKCLEVKVYWAPRSVLEERPELVKLAERFPPGTEKIRIVEIPGVDVQADGGPHVRNTCEIGEIVMLKLESKGRKRRRLYYTVKP
ncbi:MAG: alanyl-tRNA editing protein [Desulfurococcales archaeon]|nr:alanyl-tRNA editing protein [Desulfurococcales archaeon]